MRADIITILPEYLTPLRLSLLGRAIEDGTVDLRIHDLRDVTTDRHRTVDDAPSGGGAGMVMTPEPWATTLELVLNSESQVEGKTRPRLLVPSPSGRVLDQGFAAELAAEPWLVFACGRYEGIDERVYDWAAERMTVTPVSIGDYVLFGGEVAALVVLEAVTRLLPGVLGNPESLAEESHTGGLLEYPLYTRPASWRGRDIPDVLLSGNHAAIADWRRRQREQRTAERRPDLLAPASATTVESLIASAATASRSGLPAARPGDSTTCHSTTCRSTNRELTTGDAAVEVPGVRIEVRAAVPADAGELFTLQRACWMTEGRDNPEAAIPALVETLDDVRDGLRQWTTIVVRADGRLIASGRGRTSPDGSTWHVGRLMVAPDLRGRGLGRWLLRQVEALAPPSVRTFELFTGVGSTANQRMYRKAGYRRTSAPAPAGTITMRRRA